MLLLEILLILRPKVANFKSAKCIKIANSHTYPQTFPVLQYLCPVQRLKNSLTETI